jgi:hypothetical protein
VSPIIEADPDGMLFGYVLAGAVIQKQLEPGEREQGLASSQ